MNRGKVSSIVCVSFVNGDLLSFGLDVGATGSDAVSVADARVLKDREPVQGSLLLPTGQRISTVWTRIDPEQVVGVYLTSP
jgi:hypothetical protein